MKYDSETLHSIFDADSNNKLVLPDFQRDFVWTRERQSKLLASILVGLPIGSFLIIEGKNDDFPARKLSFINTTTPKEECKFLLDGQQRLSCLKSIFDDLFPYDSWKNVWDKLYGSLRNRWFLRIFPSTENTLDLFGWEKLKFPNDLYNYDPEQVQDFIVCHRVLVKGEANNTWHHPCHKILNNSGEEVTANAQRRKLLAKKYAEQGVVPLFEIYCNNQSDSLHNETLRQIANNQRSLLQAKVKDKEYSLKEMLGHLNPDVENIEEEEQKELWFELASNWSKDIKSTLEKLLEQEVLEIVLPSDEIVRAASIFETINEGGTPLSNFDLIVAKTARTGTESLAQILKKYIEEEIDIPSSIYASQTKWKMSNMKAIKENSIVRFVTDQFLNLLSILCYESQFDNGIDDLKLDHIKQAKILKLDSQQINNNFRRTIKSLRKAKAFLQYRCGIVEVNDIGYKLMILPIAYLFSLEETNDTEDELDDSGKQILTATESSIHEDKKSITDEQVEKTKVWSDKKCIDKIEYWYWSSLFSGRYKEKQNERCIQDIQYLYHWVINDNIDRDDKTKINAHFSSISENILNKQEYSDRATLLMENDENLPQKGIKYAILQYILSNQAKDFTLQINSNDTDKVLKLKAWTIAEDNQKIEEHHIIPISSATSIEDSNKKIRSDKTHLLNSPLNLSYISKKANRKISDLKPKEYLEKLTDATLTDHEISSNFINSLKSISDKYNIESYKPILEDRFNTIKRTIKTELENLIEQD
ncbi:MAG: DUF262 domain-containing protein [Xenococcaceae cyanobacterium MO_234.B1]|nr:DUF262 domain-containing protein [Xenococcaceae cyanobacterium MO_234.B1]